MAGSRRSAPILGAGTPCPKTSLTRQRQLCATARRIWVDACPKRLPARSCRQSGPSWPSRASPRNRSKRPRTVSHDGEHKRSVGPCRERVDSQGPEADSDGLEVLMLLALAIPLAFAVAAPEPAKAPPPTKPKLICREGEVELGSHIHSQGRCMTAEEWQLEDTRKDQAPATMRVNSDDGVPHPSRPQ